MPRSLPVVAVLLALASRLPADELPDGRKGVRHEIYFEGTDRPDLAGRRLVLYPVHVEGAWLEVVAGKSADFYHFMKPCLYAVDGEIPEDPAARKAFFETLPRSTPIERIATVSEADPTARIVTTYRVGELEGQILKIGKKVEFFDEKGNALQTRENALLPTLLGTSATAILLLFVAFGRRRAVRG